jgi:predicted outer membrane repeat protein
MGVLNVDGCSFLFNEAGSSGGAIHCEFIKPVLIKSSAFVGNVKTDDDCDIGAGGGAIMVWNLNVIGSFTFEDCFFYGNKIIDPSCVGIN